MPRGKQKLSLADKTRDLVSNRIELDALKVKQRREAEPLETVIAVLTEEIKVEMKENHMSSFRTEYGTPYLSLRHTPHVVDEKAVIAWLKKKKLDNEYVAPRLTDEFYEKFLKDEATRVVKPDGVEIRETESFGIRKPEQKNGTIASDTTGGGADN